MSTNLTGGGKLLTGDGKLLTGDPKRAFGRSPAPGYVVHLDAPLTNDRRPFTVAGLPSASLFTVVMVVDKMPAAEDLYMLVAILTQNDSTRTWAGYTGRNYGVNAGLTYNTYIDGFLGADDLTVLDNGRKRLLTVSLGRAGATFYAGGQMLGTVSYRNAQVSRPWSDTVYIGGEPSNPGFTFPGTIYELFGYLGFSDGDRLRTEGYLLEQHPDAS